MRWQTKLLPLGKLLSLGNPHTGHLSQHSLSSWCQVSERLRRLPTSLLQYQVNRPAADRVLGLREVLGQLLVAAVEQRVVHGEGAVFTRF